MTSTSTSIRSAALALAAAASAAGQEHRHHEAAQAAGEAPPAELVLPHQREGSGTSWMPDSSPVRAHHLMAGRWTLMLHYAVAIGYDDQWSDRGSRRFTAVDWIMGMASHPLLGGEAGLRAMLSLEAATMGGEKAFPLLLQTGESYAGAPLHDRQHPHDLFMEAAALWRRPLGARLGLELYAAASGEPALGPPAFMHRVSAMENPLPPIGHHWEDSTHITFGVLTAGLYTPEMKLEGTVFHGREPDEDRWDFDFGPLDSWSTRLSVNPTAETSLQISYGFIKSPEALRPDESMHRATASASWSAPWGAAGNLAATALWGRNIEPGRSTDAFLLEGAADLDGSNVPFARLEYVEKQGHELVVPGDPDAVYGVFQAQIGYAHRFGALGPVVPAAGIALDLGVVPPALESSYGTRTPLGAFIFLGLKPPKAHQHGSAM
ncbi:MAG TPA: hypothetical protein VMK66_21090 [Myxococcales bacterium]|nr:hypothetical protein [Myxococcales bacterium]